MNQADADRMARWVREYGPALFGFFRARVADAARADDLVQDVFCRAWQAKDRYADSGKERAYLFQIADRLCLNVARRGSRESTIDGESWRQMEPASNEQPGETLEKEENARQLEWALAALSESQRRTLLLRYYSGLGFDGIAHILGVPRNTVLSHCRRGLLTLRRLLEESIR